MVLVSNTPAALIVAGGLRQPTKATRTISILTGIMLNDSGLTLAERFPQQCP